MRFDEVYNLPKPNGASDYNDSSHLAGLLAVTFHPQAVDCRKYVVNRTVDRDTALATYVRHPNEARYDFSRDQAIMLMCGLIAQGHNAFVNLSFINGKDILPPSVRGVAKIARGEKPWPWQSAWLKLEIYWHSYLQPLEEPFQIIALCSVYGDEYLKLWTSKNKLWKWSIRRYLCELDGAWRNEPELAEWVIKFVENKINA